MEYIYIGDRHTDQALKKQPCSAVRHNYKCIRGRNGSMLVMFANGKKAVVTGRLLRKIKPVPPPLAGGPHPSLS